MTDRNRTYKADSVAVYTEFPDLPSDVRDFVAAHTQNQLCLTQSWFETLLRYAFSASQKPRIYVVRNPTDQSVECALFATSQERNSWCRPRTLMSLTNFYSMSYAPIVRPDPTSMTAAFGALAGAILRERPVWDQVDLRGLVEEEYSTKELARAFRLGGMVVDTYFQFENWYQSVAGLSGAAYFDSRPSQLRNTIRRKSKKVSRDHRLDFRLYRTAEDLEKGQEDYEAVYAQSWKDPEMYPAFVRQLLQQSAEEGRLRLGIIYVDGLPSAAQIWLVTGNRATIYKLAYDERHVQLSVGSILTKMMFDHIIDDDHVEEVDYGVGGEAYKRDWMSHRRMIVGLIGFNSRSARGLIAMVRHFAGRKLVRLSRSIGSFLSVRHLRLPLGQSVSKNPNNSVREGRDRGRQ